MKKPSSPGNVECIWRQLGSIFSTRQRPTIALPDTSPESPPPATTTQPPTLQLALPPELPFVIGVTTRAQVRAFFGEPDFPFDPKLGDYYRTRLVGDETFFPVSIQYRDDVVAALGISECFVRYEDPLPASAHRSHRLRVSVRQFAGEASTRSNSVCSSAAVPDAVCAPPHRSECRASACDCISRPVYPPMPSDALLAALLRGSVSRRDDIERLLGEPSARRCQFCPGDDVEYWFASDGRLPPLALGITYTPNPHAPNCEVLHLSIVSGYTSADLRGRERCACFDTAVDDWWDGRSLDEADDSFTSEHEFDPLAN